MNNSNPNQRRAVPMFGRGARWAAEDEKTTPRNKPKPQNTEDEQTQPMGDGKTKPMAPFTPATPMGKTTPMKPRGPVVGWMVIVSGPGRGNALPIEYGRNSIGRDASNKLSLPYGDVAISHSCHAYVIYDELGRKMYLEDGKSDNLVYLDGMMVSSTVELQARQVVRLGMTALMYIPFCGPDLDWKMLPEKLD